MPENQTGTGVEQTQESQEQTFTQADVDKIVGKARIDERRVTSARFADYDDLKAKADSAKTVEQQLAEMRAENAKMQRDNLAARIAARHGISPEDAALFLTGSDEATITAQAERLAARNGEQQRQRDNYLPNEGRIPRNGGTSDMKEFTRQLFGTKE